ncbi:MAG: methyl-accepting chemotaxis protein, partial [Rhodocyclales bacterium]|nr:methyl-accepting chemotaxis protein [Rhodocyclales bacterium]
MSIKTKIWGLVAIVLLTCALLVGVGVTGLARLHNGMTAVTGDALPDLQLASEIRTLYLSMHAAAYGRASSTDAAQGKQIEAELHRYNDEIIDRIKTLRERSTVPEEVQLLDDATAALTSYLTDAQRIGMLANVGENKMAMDVMNGKLKVTHERASAAFEKLARLTNDRVARVSKDTDAVFAASLSFSIVAAVLCLGVFAVVGYFLARSIIAPMAAMQQAITSTAESLDFTHPVPVDSHDEIGLTVMAY